MDEPAETELERFERLIAQLRATPEERARLLSAGTPFDYDAWLREAGPGRPDELAEMNELLRERDEERRRSLALEKDFATSHAA